MNDDYANAPARHRAEWAKPTLKRLNRRQVPDQAIETFERLAAAQKREMRT